MARAILFKDNGNERTYQIGDGRLITIKIDEDAVISYWENGNQIGHENDFLFVEDEFVPNRYLLARLFVPIRRQGLGRATIETFKEYFNATIWARPNDGIEQEDGSNLTGDGPSFISRMVVEGLIENNEEELDYYNMEQDQI